MIISRNSVDVVENNTAVIDVNANDDKDAEGSGLAYRLTGGVDQGSFSIDANTGELVFNTAPDFEDPGDSNSDNVYHVQVAVTDSFGLVGVQDLVVTVTNANERPIAIDDEATTAEDVPVIIDAIFNDNDPDGDELTITGVGGAGHGSVSINSDGTLEYTPHPDFFGIDTFSYTLSDPDGLTDTGQVVVTVLSAVQQLSTLDNLSGAVQQLLDDNVLNAGQANSLLTKLEKIAKSIDDDRTQVALNGSTRIPMKLLHWCAPGCSRPKRASPCLMR